MNQDFLKEKHIEQIALTWLQSLGYELLSDSDITTEKKQLRCSYSDLILEPKLRSALSLINPHIPADTLNNVYWQITVPQAPDLYDDNRRFHRNLVEGIDVEYRKADDSFQQDKVWLIDFNNLSCNNFSAVSQFTVIENNKKRRPDIVVFVNGIPLAVIELKSSFHEQSSMRHAYNQLQTYKKDIPSLFRTNSLLVISDGFEARFASLTASKEWFMPWRTIDGLTVEPKGTEELSTLLKGLFKKSVLLDLMQNFTVFQSDSAKIVKKIAVYHQYYAVNKAVSCTLAASSEKGDGRVGVIWHTQGSGKSLSMAFYAGKIIQQKSMKNPTLLVLTDRNDLDNQLFATFSFCESLLRQTPLQAQDRRHLKELLSVDVGGVVFSTIQKFAPEKGESYPLLSARKNLVVIVDEAHRSQYDFIDGFARNMREALPHASFVGFTGTPIEFSDRNTYAVFGNKIHTYDIQQAVEDGATLPIFYESRFAKIQLDESIKDHLEEDFEEVTEGEESERKEKLKNKWARLEALVGSQNRLNLVAQDLIRHFESRMEAMDGKAMVVCMSRRICSDLYNTIVQLRPTWHDFDDKKGVIKVVITGTASDPLALQPHIRNKAARDLLAHRMKDPHDPLKLVIVRDMWLTGFDAPSMHTMYIDKPMQGHLLMQAIARVNRVFKDKTGGLVVDYLGIADSLKKALANYSEADQTHTAVPQDTAIALMTEKYEFIKQLFHGFDYSKALYGQQQEKLSVILAAVEHLLSQEEKKERFIRASLAFFKVFALCAASQEARKIRDEVSFFQYVRSVILKSTVTKGKDREELDSSLKQLVSGAVLSTEMVDIFAAAGLEKPDISILSDQFLAGFKKIKTKKFALESLRKILSDSIKKRAQKNIVQARNFTNMLESSIKKYQNRQIETAQVIEELIQLAKEMQEAIKKGQNFGLNEDEAAFYDALADNKSAKDVLGDSQLREIACELAKSIRENSFIDWTLKESVKASMRLAVKRILNKYGYPPDLQKKATQTVLEQAELLSSA